MIKIISLFVGLTGLIALAHWAWGITSRTGKVNMVKSLGLGLIYATLATVILTIITIPF